MTLRQVGRHKKAFLAAFALHANVSAACRVVGIARSNVYRWQEHDEAFALAFKQAEIESLEVLEGEAFRRAYEGVKSQKGIYHGGELVGVDHKVEYSDALLIFLLKARAPERYRERASYEHTAAGAALPAVKEIWYHVPLGEVPPPGYDADGPLNPPPGEDSP